LALQGFGGVLAVAQQELVERRKWMSKTQFLEEWSIAQIMPGPNIVNLALMVGRQHFGIYGALSAVSGLLIAPMGLVLLLAFLTLRGHVPASMDLVGSCILQHLGLLFIPASVGVVLYLPLLHANAWAITAALVLSVVATVAVTALVLKLFAKKDTTP
jgi:chromate transporter